ncbi:MAG TPA: T9SS type A sorting domain-containing protein, partial [Bacteroidia bacterium]|nr:T9SS type A sorting domain-containing protein [Bacteroidia bacterium]
VNTAGVNTGNGSVVIVFKLSTGSIGAISGPVTVCQGSSETYYSTSNGSPYTWSVPAGSVINSGQGTDTINVTFGAAPGKIKLVQLGCVNDSDSVAVTVNPLPVVSFSAAKDSICVNYNKDTLIGSPAGGTFSGTGVTGSNFDPNTAGAGVHKIKYVYTDINGCTNSDSMLIVVNVCAGIDEVNLIDNEIKLYPNPFAENVNVNIGIDGPVTISMFNMLGENMGTWRVKKGNSTIDTKGIPSGVYNMEIKTNAGVLNKKLVKVN